MSGRREEVGRRIAHAIDQLEGAQRQVGRCASEQRLPDGAVHAVAALLLRNWPCRLVVLRAAAGELAQIRDRLDRFRDALGTRPLRSSR